MDRNLDILREQLQQLRQREEIYFRQRAFIKNWCVTVWSAILLVIFTRISHTDRIEAILILGFPVLFFWGLEGISDAIQSLYGEHSIELEKRISENRLSVDNPVEVFMSSRHLQFSTSDKAIAFFKSTFTRETVLVFYLCLIGASILLAFILIE
ncbi:MAG: hypothetical protein ACFFCW_06390 [Candidatus Hodarchaeota archaeon]